MTDNDLTRYLGGRHYSLCLVVVLAAFVGLLLDRIDGALAAGIWTGAIGVNTGGQLLQDWWARARELQR